MGKPSKTIAETSSVSTQNCAVLDVAYLDRVTFGESPLRDELINLFQSQIDSTLAKLPLISRPEDWRFTAHSLRGAAGALGAEEIAALCASWEDAGLPPAPEVTVCQAKLQAAALRFKAAVAKLKR